MFWVWRARYIGGSSVTMSAVWATTSWEPAGAGAGFEAAGAAVGAVAAGALAGAAAGTVVRAGAAGAPAGADGWAGRCVHAASVTVAMAPPVARSSSRREIRRRAA